MSEYQFAQFRFDADRGCLTRHEPPGDTQEIQLRHKVASLLSYLIEHRERVVSKDELLSELWQQGDYRENSLTQSVRELRVALGDKAKDSTFIKTYPQRGYQWICPLSAHQAPNPQSPPDTVPLAKPIADPIPVDEPVPASRERVKRSVLGRRLFLATTMFMLAAGILWFTLAINSEQHQTGTGDNAAKATNKIQALLVLPFINATEDPSMAWLELGLADMLAIDIQRSNQLQVTPPAMANALLLDAQLQWPALPVHIRSLLREHQLDAALFASVRLHNQQQVLDFQLIYADGKTKQGSISYPSLPAASQSISQQMLHLLHPQHASPITLAEDNPLAAQALVEGMQALQQTGPVQAKKYFQASMVLDDTSAWARAYLARSRYALGDWQVAETLFDGIGRDIIAADPSLDAFIHYWRAELAFRRGSSDLQRRMIRALHKAEAANDTKQMARSYRLQAQVAWQQMDWPAHRAWLAKAERLFGSNNQLSIEADKLFYLGNPSNEGLEKNPENDLQANQVRLLKALNFYQQLGNQNMIAASQFAIAQNYTFDLATREAALTQTLAFYRQLAQPYELAQALNYAGFYQMQLHDGKAASVHFEEAKQIAQRLGATPLLKSSDFYLAFAKLDQGLDQSALGRHGKNSDKLTQAVDLLDSFIASDPSPIMEANARVFLGWAHTDLGDLDEALIQLTRAKTLNQPLDMPTTSAYISYSLMRIHLERHDYQAVIDLASAPIITRLQASYLARAYYEQGQTHQAIEVLQDFKDRLPGLWQTEDSTRLGQYRATTAGTPLLLGPEPKAHLVYCESDWVL